MLSDTYIQREGNKKNFHDNFFSQTVGLTKVLIGKQYLTGAGLQRQTDHF